MLFAYLAKMAAYPFLRAFMSKENRILSIIRKLVFYSEIYEILVQAYIEFILAAAMNYECKPQDPNNNIINSIYIWILLFILILWLPLIILWVAA